MPPPPPDATASPAPVGPATDSLTPAPAPNPPRPSTPWARTRAAASRTCGGALLPYSIISLSYILFTTTDGALRMVVLLHAYSLGFSALTLAAVFAGYEAAGVVVNLGAGAAAARWGIRATLLTGLTLQLAALGALFAWQPGWAPGAVGPIVFLAAIQVLSGCAKVKERERGERKKEGERERNGGREREREGPQAGRESEGWADPHLAPLLSSLLPLFPPPFLPPPPPRTSSSWAARPSPSWSPPTTRRARCSSWSP